MTGPFSNTIETSLMEALDHPPPFTRQELEGVDTLRLEAFDSWMGLDQLPSLARLRVGELPSNRALAGLPTHLKTVGVFDSTVSSIDLLGDFPRLRRVSLENTNVSSIGGLVRCLELRHLKVLGCPLSREGRAAAEELSARGVKIVLSDEEEWRTTLALRATGLEANYHDGCVRFPGPGYQEHLNRRRFEAPCPRSSCCPACVSTRMPSSLSLPGPCPGVGEVTCHPIRCSDRRQLWLDATLLSL